MSTARSTRSATSDERGTGLIATVFGVVVFLVFLLLAVQVIFDLYARSALTATAYDAARIVAGADADASAPAQADAEAGVRRILGRYGSRVSFTWEVDPDAVALAVHVRNPTVLPALVTAPLGLDTIDRTVRVRREEVR